MNKRRAVAAQTARSRVNLYTHCLGTIDIPGQVVYLSRESVDSSSSIVIRATGLESISPT